MSDKRRYSFIEKKKSRTGRRSVFLSGLSFGLFLLALLISFFRGGSAGYSVGVLTVVAMLFALYGFYLGMRALTREREGSTAYSLIGTLAGGILSVGFLTVFLAGL